MIDTEKKPVNLIEAAKDSIRRTLEDVKLMDYLKLGEGKIRIAVLGAGSAIEVDPFSRYIQSHGYEPPSFIAYDINSSGERLAKSLAGSADLEYRVGDFTDKEMFRNDVYNMIIIRNPDVHKSEENWRLGIKNALSHLKEKGVFLVTTIEERAHSFMISELKTVGEIRLDCDLPQDGIVSPYFNEQQLVIVEKTK